MRDLLQTLGLQATNPGAATGGAAGWLDTRGEELVSVSPIDGRPIAAVRMATADDYEAVMTMARTGFQRWRMIPAPQRGKIIGEIGCALLQRKESLARLITMESGKILEEARGEIQEMIDVADFALGLSRQLYGLTMPSERPHHRMFEQWHPLGIVGVISSFNFPAAVWSWNALIAAVCGDAILWKPSSKTPLTAIAIHRLLDHILDRHNLRGVFNLVIGSGREVGERMTADRRLPLISATGSCDMGRRIGQQVAARLGRSLLELGGNNAIIVAADADLDLALEAAVFSAIGTAGQRCTSARRLMVHHSLKEIFLHRLIDAYGRVIIGHPLDESVTMGPLIDATAVTAMMDALDRARRNGGRILYGGKKLKIEGLETGFYVEPAIVEAPRDLPVMMEETFAPIVYVVEYDQLADALALNNAASEGLSSALITDSLRAAEEFLSARGTDCGIANVNGGTIGAEIGGAFGGEKDTGGGRESGSDAWKAYMRRQTVTINWGPALRKAQGIRFDVSARPDHPAR